MERTLDPKHPFYINKDMVGDAMKQQAIDLYNHYAYWNEQLGAYEHARKTIVAAQEQARDKRNNVNTLQAAVDICRSALSWDKQEHAKVVT
jgi:hypothetical protein